MRGLPFPDEALLNRGQSLDFVSPGPGANGVGAPLLSDVPFDPALSGPSSAPAYLSHVNGVNGVNGHVVQQDDSIHQSFPMSPTYQFGQYPQGPEGDPFAPPPHFFPEPTIGSAPDDHSEMVHKPVKRGKRRPRREEMCSFCNGNDGMNETTGKPEHMVTCSECGRCGHPSCMELGAIGDTIRTYPWKCSDCKACEICNEKGNEARILFCDNCDRGWHTYCLDPPLEENPEGSWFCPQCPPPPGSTASMVFETEPQPSVGQEVLDPQLVQEPQIDPALQMESDIAMEIDPALREESLAPSTVPSEPQRQSRSKAKTKSQKRDRKGKGRALILSEEEEEQEHVDVEVEAVEEDEDEMYPPISTPRGRASLNGRRKSNTRPRRRSESIPDDVKPPSPPLRPQKKMKLNVRSPSPPVRQRHSGATRPKVMVRIRLPGKGKGREEDEEDEAKKSMFDDVLEEWQRDTSRTSILNGDKERFEKSRVIAESKLLPPPQSDPIDLSSIPGPSSSRFPLRSAVHQLQQQQTQALMPVSSSTSPTPSTPGPSHIPAKYDPSVLRIRTIRFGPYDIQTWYDAPFPEEFSNIPEGRLWICEFCLKYMKSRFGAQRHRLKCKCRHPPGDEIYRDGSISIFEVDGRKNKIYCQHLCLLSKMFLDHKSLFYDVEPFLFYVMTEVDDIGARFVGYFSKEKRSSKDLNLSCIMTLPVRQRQGWGNLLIDFSYLLSQKEQKCGTPERPLSALGAIGYKKYWTLAIIRYLHEAPSNPRLEDVSAATGMTVEDIYHTLVHLNMITIREGPSSPVRPSPGRSVKLTRNRKNGVARRNLQKAQPADDEKSSKPFVPPTNYEIHWDADEVSQFLEEWNAKGYLTLKPEKLKWAPFLLSRADKLVTPLEDVLTTGPVDVEMTPTTPDPAASVSGSVRASGSVTDGADVRDVTPLVTPFTESGQDAPSVSSAPTPHDNPDYSPRPSDAGHPPEPEGSPTPTPSPPPVMQPKPRSVNNALEALAAVACVVSIANPPVDVRRRSSTMLPLGEAGRPTWGQNAMNGSSTKPLSTSQLSQYANSNPATPVHETRSRRPATKTENDDRLPASNELTMQRSRPDVYPLVMRKYDDADTPISPSPSNQRVSVEKDAELAARLAREESIQTRSLRSASHSLSRTPTLASRESRPKESPVRKRPKAPSIRDPSPPTPVSPDRPTTRRQAQVLALESARANNTGRVTRRHSSRLAPNGGDSEALSISNSPSKRSTRLNGASKSSVAPQSPAKSARGQAVTGAAGASQRNGTQKGRSTRSSTRRGQSPSEQSITTERTAEEEGDVDIDVDADAEGESDADMDADGETEGDPVPLNGDVSMNDQGGITVDSHTDATATKAEPNGSSRVALGKMNGTRDQDDLPVIADADISGSLLASTSMDAVNDGAAFAPDKTTTRKSISNSNLPGAVLQGEDEDDMDAEGEPDDEDADGEPDPDVFS